MHKIFLNETEGSITEFEILYESKSQMTLKRMPPIPIRIVIIIIIVNYCYWYFDSVYPSIGKNCVFLSIEF